MTAPILALTGLPKRFGGVTALDGVSLELFTGQVTALIGENGAGKSTIVKVLTGIYRPDAGEIRLGGAPVSFAGPQDAARAGIAAIHQETVRFDALMVAENVHLGHAPRTRRGPIEGRRCGGTRAPSWSGSARGSTRPRGSRTRASPRGIWWRWRGRRPSRRASW